MNGSSKRVRRSALTTSNMKNYFRVIPMVGIEPT
uniref:Uncharacterized protein n=1 Tax=Siphoviridae sp. ctg4a4 TaxID=2825602 RepID=A0A8S5V5Y9_9CAUD|nr:MAG TPA: hypothetical protein [Siphoviridae sp. ctg4a4]DAG34629.1 MAG TPA: hypothetical protein [Caudoviricetes sp.]DAO87204.1 MAG TPA: hypothetical protein [Caudoviricetes sp.]DAR24814.1 MAG TPA: hypothetical protein [Caudoviricetes sp.]